MIANGRLWERRALAAGALVLLLLVLCAGYRVFRSGGGRLFADFFYPYLRLARVGADSLSDKSLLSYSHAELAVRLEQLQRQNRSLTLQAAAAGELLQENEELRKLMEFAAPVDRVYIPGEIILRDPLLWRERFTVDRGAGDGIRPGAAVIDVGADSRPLLVGVIERVGEHSSTVLSVYNGALRFSGKLGASGAVGFVNSGTARRGDGSIPIGFLPVSSKYQPGEAVLTTGFEAGIPPGLVIGELEAVEDIGSIFANALHLSGTIRPAVNFDGLRFVVIAGVGVKTAGRM